MAARRGLDDVRLLCAGPGRLCQALAITKEHDGARLDRSPFAIYAPAEAPEILAVPRIGINRAEDRPWRFVLPARGFSAARRLRLGAGSTSSSPSRRPA